LVKSQAATLCLSQRLCSCSDAAFWRLPALTESKNSAPLMRRHSVCHGCQTLWSPFFQLFRFIPLTVHTACLSYPRRSRICHSKRPVPLLPGCRSTPGWHCVCCSFHTRKMMRSACCCRRCLICQKLFFRRCYTDMLS
jgi:hypothetical protein